MGVKLLSYNQFDTTSSSRIIKYVETNFSTLNSNISDQQIGDIAETVSSSGTWLLGNLNPEGFYRWDGVDWIYKGQTLQDAISDNQVNITSNDSDIAQLQADQFKVKSTSSDPMPAYLVNELPSNDHIYFNFGIDSTNGNQTLVSQLRQRFRPFISSRNPLTSDNLSIPDPLITAVNFQTTQHSVGQVWINNVDNIAFVSVFMDSTTAIWERITPLPVFAVSTKLGLVNQNTTFEPILIRESLPNVDISTGTWSILVPQNGDYKYSCNIRHSLNSTTLNFLFHVLTSINGGAGTFESILHVESKDSQGTGIFLPRVLNDQLTGQNINTGTDQFLQSSGVTHFLNLSKGDVITFRPEFSSGGNNLEAAIYDFTNTFELIINRNND